MSLFRPQGLPNPPAREDEAHPDPEAVVPHVGQGVHLPAEDDAPPGGHLRGEGDAHRRSVHLDFLRQGEDLKMDLGSCSFS